MSPRRAGKLKSVDLYDKTKHSWSGPHFSCGLWTMGYHIPSEYTGLTVILRVYGETKFQCVERMQRIDKALIDVLIKEVSR